MLCKLSLKNIRKSFKDYAIYFFTLILGVCIFYVFNALESQTVMINVSLSTQKIIELMNYMMNAVSVFVSFILGFLIIYASRFLIKRRNKEFGIYLTLGMGKRKISKILLFETIFIGVISLVVGLTLGVVISQFMSLLVANMFEADLTNFKFIFSESACIKTLIYFGIIYLVVAIFNVVNVSKCKLIDLIQSSKRQEEVKMKNPILCTLVFVVASIMLGYAYYLVTAGASILDEMVMILIPISLGTVSTFLIVWSLSGLILRIVMSVKNLYYKGLNSFVLRQISSKINTTVMSMGVICLMLFVTICVLSSALSLKNSMTQNLLTLVPVDIQLVKTLDRSEGSQILIDDSKISIVDTLEKGGFSTSDYLKDILEVTVYVANDITLETTLGSYYDEARVKYPMLIYSSVESFIKVSDYNKIAKIYGNDEISLSDDEYVIVADFENWANIRNEALKLGTTINILGGEYKPKYQECVNGYLYMSGSHINTGIIVVPDSALDDSIREESILFANYNADSDEDKERIENMIIDLDKNDYISNIELDASSKISIYGASVGLGACVTFIGIYLGIIFLISSAAILALKELSESSDNKERYKMLRKLGTDEKMINRALFKQTAIFFGFPLLLAIIHSVFGIIFCDYILSVFGNEKLLASIVMTALILLVIYGGYFVITYTVSKNIIKD